MTFSEDLDELDRIWPLGKQLVVPDGGTVLVAGAYEGRYMDYVATRFKPATVIGYEPQADKAAIARERLLSRHNAGTFFIYDTALGVHDGCVPLRDTGTDGCRIADLSDDIDDLKRQTLVGMMGIDTILNDGADIDLFICNMEGYEIPLLSYVWAAEMLPQIQSLAVQFHSDSKQVATMLTAHYGPPVYNDFPTWCYWRS